MRGKEIKLGEHYHKVWRDGEISDHIGDICECLDCCVWDKYVVPFKDTVWPMRSYTSELRIMSSWRNNLNFYRSTANYDNRDPNVLLFIHPKYYISS